MLLLASCLVLSAQETRLLEVRTLCFNYSQGARKVTIAGDPEGNSQAEFKLTKYMGTTQQKMSIAGNTLFLDAKAGGDVLGKWGKVAIPPKFREVLLVFFPVSDKSKPYRVVAFDDSSSAFPLGSFQLVNTSPSPLRFVVGEIPFQLKPGERKVISEFKNMKANGQISYYAYYLKDQDWQRLSTGFWDVIPQKRNLQIAFGDSKTKSVQMRGFEDSLPVMKALLEAQSGGSAKN